MVSDGRGRQNRGIRLLGRIARVVAKKKEAILVTGPRSLVRLSAKRDAWHLTEDRKVLIVYSGGTVVANVEVRKVVKVL